MTAVRAPGPGPDDGRRALQAAEQQAAEAQGAPREESTPWMRRLITRSVSLTAYGGATVGAVVGGRHHPSALVAAVGLVVLLVLVGGLVYPQILFARKGASVAKTADDVAKLTKASAASFTHLFAALFRGQTADDVYPAEQRASGARQGAAEQRADDELSVRREGAGSEAFVHKLDDLQRQIDDLRAGRDRAERPAEGPGGDGGAA